MTVTAERAREEARRAEKAVLDAAGPADLPPLHGVPVPIKDLNMVDGVRMTFGSAAYAEMTGFADDHVVTKLAQAVRAAGQDHDAGVRAALLQGE